MRVAICEDEEYQRNTIIQFIMNHTIQYPGITVSAFTCGEDLLSAYEHGDSFDLIFLDIQMKDMNGIATAYEIRKKSRHAILFFITGHTQYVSAAFALSAFQFLIKPVRQDTFDREFKRAVNKYHRDRQKYVINTKASTMTLEIKDIHFMEIRDHRIVIHSETQEYIKSGKLNDEEKKMRPYGFIRTHQSYLVNMAYIRVITEKDVIMTNGKQAAVSARKRAEVLAAFNQYLAGYAL